MSTPKAPAFTAASSRALSAPEFHQLAQMPLPAKWFASLHNPNTRRAYRTDLEEFTSFVGITRVKEFRLVTRGHVLAWREELDRREFAASTLRRKLAAVSSWFEYLAAANAIAHNPVTGIARPPVRGYQPKTEPLEDEQARQMLRLPAGGDDKSRRDRALLSLVLRHGVGRNELSSLRVLDMNVHRGGPHLCIAGKRGRQRNVPLHPSTLTLLADYLQVSGHAHQKKAALFRPIRNNRNGQVNRPLSADGIYKLVRGYARRLGLKIGVQTLRVTAAAKALEHADLAEVQEWLGHANIATTRLYDRRRRQSDDATNVQIQY